jgi:hypothetical protein
VEGATLSGKGGHEVTKCRSCDAEVLWVTLPSGKRCPIDVEQRPDGNVKLDGCEAADGNQAAHVAGAKELVDLRASKAALYISHFATCPSAGEWRR